MDVSAEISGGIGPIKSLEFLIVQSMLNKLTQYKCFFSGQSNSDNIFSFFDHNQHR